MIRIAHLSDPHINQKYHPEHLAKLEAVLLDAIHKQAADHIVITGDISSNAEERDLLATKDLFRKLDILDSSKLTLVIGNHDIFGGPHLAEDVLGFPRACKDCKYHHKISEFQRIFQPLFKGVYYEANAYPFVKLVRGTAIIGLNSVAEHSQYRNPVGSNGAIDDHQFKALQAMLETPMVQNAKHRVLAMHHHLFRRKDEKHLHSYSTPKGLFSTIEQETLKLRKKRRLIALLEKSNVETVLHGHVHFTGDYPRKKIRCYNAAGSIFPLIPSDTLSYNLLTFTEKGTSLEVPSVLSPLDRSLI
jgi:3',5'-cyclic AMP phosphodiesterase CpdA